MRNYFTIADTSQDRKVTENEMMAFLDSINIKLKKDQLKKLIKVRKKEFILTFRDFSIHF